MFALIGLAAVVLLGVVFYARARMSRRRYRCPNCGETLTAELMTASRCNSCGAALEDIGPG